MNNPESFEPAPDPGTELGGKHISFSDCEPRFFPEQGPNESAEDYARRQMMADETRFIIGLVRSGTQGVDGMKSAMADGEDYRITRKQLREVWDVLGTMTSEEYEETVNSVWDAFPNQAARDSAEIIANHLRYQSQQYVKENAAAEALATLTGEEPPEEIGEAPGSIAQPAAPESSWAPDKILSPGEAARRYRGEKQKRRGGFFKKLKSKVREVLTGEYDDYDEEEVFRPWGAVQTEPVFAANRPENMAYPEPVPAGRLFSDETRFSTEHKPGFYFGGVEEVPTDPGDPIEPPITETGSNRPSVPRGLRPTEIPDIGSSRINRGPRSDGSETDISSLGRPSVLSHNKGTAPLPRKAPSVFRHLGDAPSDTIFPKKSPSVLRPVKPIAPLTESGKGPEETSETSGKPEKAPETDGGKPEEAAETGEKKKPVAPTVELDGESVSVGEFASRLIKERARVEGTSLDESVKKGEWNKETLSHIGADGAPREWAQLTGWLKKHPEEMARFVEEYETLKTKPAPGEDTGTDIGEEHLPFSKFEQVSFDTSRHLDAKNNDFETVGEYQERLRARDKRRFMAYFLAQQSGGSEATAALKGAEDFVITEEQEKQFETAVQGMDDEEYSRVVKQALEAAIPDDGEHPFTFPDHSVSDAHADDIRDYYWTEFARKIKPESEATKKKRIENWEEVKKARETAPAESTDAPEDTKAA